MVKVGKKIGFHSRPPIVVVLGHVDHGKTTLLDKIRQTSVASREAGGITQHIGACQITYCPKKTPSVPKPTSKIITFIDTPGHVAFSQMRSSGARVADLALLVVAADEGVKPQTLESLRYINEAKINYLVVLSKIDIPNIKIERSKKLLSEAGIPIESYGGDIVVVPASAKTGEGISDILEMILLLAEMTQLAGAPEKKLEAVVIESKLDRQRGPTATVLIRDGSLKVGDEIRVGNLFAKVRALYNERGEQPNVALPSQPIEVLGFEKIPPVGGIIEVIKGDVSAEKTEAHKISGSKKEPIEVLEETPKKLRIILKADVTGTLEAITSSLPSECMIILAAVGDVNESDVFLAETTKAEIIAFNVKITSSVKKLAETQGVQISYHKTIYELLETIEKKVLVLVKPDLNEKALGQAEVIAEFKIKNERIAGCRVKEGEIVKENPLRLKRGEKILGTTRIKSMRKGKIDVDRAKVGDEFGIIFSSQLDFTIGDMVVSVSRTEGK